MVCMLNQSDLGLCFLPPFLHTPVLPHSRGHGVTCLFKLLPWDSFKRLSLAQYRAVKFILMILWTSSASVLMSTFSLLVFLIWTFSLSLSLLWLRLFPFCWLFSKNQLFVSLILCLFGFFITLISFLNLVTSCHLLLWSIISCRSGVSGVSLNYSLQVFCFSFCFYSFVLM